MYSSLKIEGFRRFRELEIHELKQVNLLVGRNNSGKSSVLEALSMLADPASLMELSRRRGELLLSSDEQDSDIRLTADEELDISCLFHKYTLGNGGFRLAGMGSWNHSLKAEVDAESSSELDFRLDDQEVFSVELSKQLGLPLWERDGRGVVRRARHPFPSRNPENAVPLLLIESVGYPARRLAAELGKVLLTPEEDLLLEALRLIDPSILRIAPLPDSSRSRSDSQKSGIFVLCEGTRRLPLGNMGEGVWRLLMIALSLVNSAKGILLVDEIDTGLHYTVLEGMWRLVLKTAERLDVQVFATTHSDDCWKALARVLEAETGSLDDAASLQRLEAGNTEAVVFPGNLIRIANQNKIEVR